MRNKYKFELTDSEANKYEEWLKTLPKVENGNFGAAGGGYYFKFIPTGIGTIAIAGRVDVPEMEINLTDFDNW